MKKITVLILVLIMCACSKVEHKKEESQAQDNILSFDADLSGYENLEEQYQDIFKAIDLTGLQDILDNKKSAFVLISHTSCHNCQDIINDVAKYAKENNVTLYYFDASKVITSREVFDKTLELLDPVLRETENGKTIFTPEIIKIEDGEFVDYYIGTGLQKIFKIIK